MVSSSPDNGYPATPVSSSLPEAEISLHHVTVPVFINVAVMADGPDQAEYLAVEAVRRMKEFGEEDIKFRVMSIISPMSQDTQG